MAIAPHAVPRSKCLEIDLLPGTTEHLPDIEGLDAKRGMKPLR
jgi:hypothetical protein